ncbi:MAG TPA: PDGLE domain-containing protein [Ignavibacteria bacterium]
MMMKKHSILISIIIVFIIAVFLSPIASTLPDGLEYTAEKLGFIQKESLPVLNSTVPGYSFGFIKNEYISKALAGAVGVIIILISGWGIERLMRKRK